MPSWPMWANRAGHVVVLATTLPPKLLAFACSNFWLGNFMELGWRYLGSSIAGSVGSSWVMWGERRVGYVVPGKKCSPLAQSCF